MALPTFMEGYPEDQLVFWMYVDYVILGLVFLYYFSRAGRPVAHSDRKLGSKHNDAETERVEILERLKSGSKLDDGRLKAGDDSPLQRADISDIEKEPLRSPLLPTSNQDANVATISLSETCEGNYRLPSEAYKSMKKIGLQESVDDSFICSPDRTMLQSKVELHDGMLERLKDLLKEVPKPPKEFTLGLQVDNWAILKPSGRQVDVLRLPVDKVPVILHAEYAAGLLTITGLNLEHADIQMSAENANHTLTLSVWRLLKGTPTKKFNPPAWRRFSDTKEDIATVPVRFSSRDMKGVFVYATKKVYLGGDGESVNAVSKAVRVVDSFWSTVTKLWIPTIVAWIFTIYSFRLLLANYPYAWTLKIDSFWPFHGFSVMIITTALLMNTPQRVVEFVKYHAETLMGGFAQGLMVFYYGFKSLNGPRLEILKSLPPPPSSPPPPSALRRSPPTTRVAEPPSEARDESPVDDPDWEWPAFDEFEDKPGKITLKRRFEEVRDEVSPFRAVYLRKSGVLWPDVVRVDLFSTPLIKIVQKFFPQNGDLQCLETPNIKGRDLFLALEGLKNHKLVEGSDDDLSNPPHSVTGCELVPEGKGELHAKHLVRFLEKEFHDVSLRLRRMTEEKRVAWDMLWAFFTPGKKVVYICEHSQEVLAGVVSTNSYVRSLMSGDREKVFSIDLEMWDYDGKSYHQCQINRKIQKYEGEFTFSSLAVRPIEMEGVPELLEEGFLANGKRFRELGMSNSHRFMHYSGPMFRMSKSKGCMEIVKENADGRVMIDLASFARMNPSYPMGTAKPPVASYSETFDPVRGRRIQCTGTVSTVHMEASDETLIFAPAIVYGFSFTLKHWGSFAISGFNEIWFSSNAFDALVMEPDRKQLVYDLVSQYIATPAGPSQAGLQRVDPISNKGEGCIFLCYGPPGTGKTLTAESLAENMHRPLWSLSASELGTTPNELELTLFKILDIAASWRAVLLLDEADVFLEKRNSPQSLTRNAMTGVFLRFLEYYRGVLFLNTNRIETFDSAFRSRISMFMHYPELSIEHKAQVWTTLLERAGVADASAEFISQMAVEDLNGREIRNIIHTAQIWAKSKGQTLREDHVRYSKSVLLLSLRTLSETMKTCPVKTLKSAPGGEDDARKDDA